MSDPTLPVAVGEVVGEKYKVVRLLGKGGMGAVFEAKHVALKHRVALKFVVAEIAASSEAKDRFMREGKACALLTSPHAVRVMDTGVFRGAPYHVMELLQGDDLERIVAKRGPLRVEEAVGYVLDACEALAEAHALGIVHRDLKPSNLFCVKRAGAAPSVKVIDFGLAKDGASFDAKLTASTAVLGSPAYMSPEQLKSSRDIDARSDVFSLAGTFVTLLTGRLPFAGEAIAHIFTAILTARSERVSSYREDVPRGLVDALDQALEKELGDRTPSMLAFAEAIAPFGPASMRERPAGIAELVAAAKARRAEAADESMIGLLATLPAGVPGAAEIATQGAWSAADTQVDSPRRKRLFAAVGGVLLVAAAAGGLWIETRPASVASQEGPAAAAPPSSPPSALSSAVTVASPPVAPPSSAPAAPASPPPPVALSSLPLASSVPRIKRPLGRVPLTPQPPPTPAVSAPLGFATDRGGAP